MGGAGTSWDSIRQAIQNGHLPARIQMRPHERVPTKHGRTTIVSIFPTVRIDGLTPAERAHNLTREYRSTSRCQTGVPWEYARGPPMCSTVSAAPRVWAGVVICGAYHGKEAENHQGHYRDGPRAAEPHQPQQPQPRSDSAANASPSAPPDTSTSATETEPNPTPPLPNISSRPEQKPTSTDPRR